ncbi:Homocysteine synthase [Lachnellula occidentalis]|uniref:Homocysteine synthase n=1 Tax=Lachnellula occidentalis TaxID=215460 RepID=A0A8H8UEQ4_9HELO|nr:Homocysteine synthase [Lachnellula occidentalis]
MTIGTDSPISNSSQNPSWEFETQLLHAGISHGARLLNLSEFGSFYSRFTNACRLSILPSLMCSQCADCSVQPTVNVLQNRMAELEGGVAACGVASGSAAVVMTMLALAGAGDNFISSFHVHAGTFHQFGTLAKQMGIECRFVDSQNPVDFEAAIDGKTKFVWVESISNPGNVILDFKALSLICQNKGIPLICDNTFGCAGYFCRPIEHGVDIVVHSATKWIGGHGTTIGGIIIDGGTFDWGKHTDRFPQFHDPKSKLWERFSHRAFAVRCQFEILRDTGSTLSAPAAQQLLIGLESLAVRCERHAQNTAELADWLQEQPLVAWVNYIGHKDHQYHQEALKYFKRGFGSVICFGLRGGFQACARFCNALKMVIITTNLGDAKTLVVHPASTTHEHFSPEERAKSGVTEDMIRLSVGIEQIRDIKADFKQAFEHITEPGEIRKVNKGKIHLQNEINRRLYGPSACL